MRKIEIIVLTFFVTGFYDVLLRYSSLNFDKLTKKIKSFLPFMKSLKNYFSHYSLLSAFLLAAFVGALTQSIILYTFSFPNSTNTSYLEVILFFIWTFIVSALFGYIIKLSGLFPVLEKTYYRYLDKGYSSFLPLRSLYHDGISGIIVQITVFSIVMMTS